MSGTHQIHIKGMTGKTNTYNVKPTNTVGDLKKIIEQRTQVPTNAQTLLFAGKPLENGRSLQDYGMIKNSHVYLVIRESLNGGKRKTRRNRKNRKATRKNSRR